MNLKSISNKMQRPRIQNQNNKPMNKPKLNKPMPIPGRQFTDIKLPAVFNNGKTQVESFRIETLPNGKTIKVVNPNLIPNLKLKKHVPLPFEKEMIAKEEEKCRTEIKTLEKYGMHYTDY